MRSEMASVSLALQGVCHVHHTSELMWVYGDAVPTRIVAAAETTCDD